MRRRRLLQAALGMPLLGWRNAPAQAPGRTLLTAPRRALVIGNSAYRVGPLRNPANDARSIAGELERQGFEVSLGLDLKRAEMMERIGAHRQALQRAKPVALFYFAGHGLQLAWRNYLVPIDASVKSAADVQAQCVDVNAVIEGIGKAANPMNVIILDACRDDPFGASGQKGLSQLDAPPGTLLAYATSPGNVASDGDGANGLYTENLLREMKVPEAKIEDVFKRVRLAVRRRSNGRQIPWESTSLEEDFWFIPPKSLQQLAEDEAERVFLQELAIWEKADGAQTPAALEDYLRRHPSGRFAELAQLQLDELLRREGEQRIRIAASEGNPFTQGSARSDLGYKVGDSYTYTWMDRATGKVLGRLKHEVSAITATQVLINQGDIVLDRLGNLIREHAGRSYSPRQDQPLEYAVGKRWSTRFTAKSEKRGSFAAELDFRIARRERITVAAGTFDCFVIDGEGWQTSGRGARIRLGMKRWMAPERCRRPILSEEFRRFEHDPSETSRQRGRDGMYRLNERLELAAFTQS
jgi:hypothetical protein